MIKKMENRQLVREILNAAERHGVDQGKSFLVATTSCMPQDLLVSGFANLKTASGGAHLVAVRCNTEVFVYDVALGELSRVQNIP